MTWRPEQGFLNEKGTPAGKSWIEDTSSQRVILSLIVRQVGTKERRDQLAPSLVRWRPTRWKACVLLNAAHILCSSSFCREEKLVLDYRLTRSPTLGPTAPFWLGEMKANKVRTNTWVKTWEEKHTRRHKHKRKRQTRRCQPALFGETKATRKAWLEDILMICWGGGNGHNLVFWQLWEWPGRTGGAKAKAGWVLNGCDKAVSTLYDGSNYISTPSNTSLIHLWQCGCNHNSNSCSS